MGEKFKPIVSIIIPVKDQATLTSQCFASIRANTRTPYELIWIDNGSSADQFSIIRRQATRPNVHCKLIKNPDNLGFIQATNQGIVESRGDFIIFLNNDTIVSYDWIKELIRPLKNNKKIGAIGPITQSKISWQQADHLNRKWKLNIPPYSNNVEKYSSELRNKFGGKYMDIEKLPLSFFCVALRSDVVKKVGFLCEDLGIGLGDDDEYCARLRYNGYKLLLSLGTFIYHYHRTTFKYLKINTDSIRRVNLAILRKKYKDLKK